MGLSRDSICSGVAGEVLFLTTDESEPSVTMWPKHTRLISLARLLKWSKESDPPVYMVRRRSLVFIFVL